MKKPLTPRKQFGIWNTSEKEFQFGIQTETAIQAEKGLFSKIGYDYLKWRFIAQIMDEKHCNLHNETQIKKKQTHIDSIKYKLLQEERTLSLFKHEAQNIQIVCRKCERGPGIAESIIMVGTRAQLERKEIICRKCKTNNELQEIQT